MHKYNRMVIRKIKQSTLGVLWDRKVRKKWVEMEGLKNLNDCCCMEEG